MGCYFRDDYTFDVKAENVAKLKAEYAALLKKVHVEDADLTVSDTARETNGVSCHRVFMNLGGSVSYSSATAAEELGSKLVNEFRWGTAEIHQECDGETGTHYLADSDQEAAEAEADKYVEGLRLMQKRLSKEYLQKVIDEIHAWGL